MPTRPFIRTDSGGGGGEFQGNLMGGGECHLFFAEKSCCAFGQLAFFLAGNHMTTFAFEKRFL